MNSFRRSLAASTSLVDLFIVEEEFPSRWRYSHNDSWRENRMCLSAARFLPQHRCCLLEQANLTNSDCIWYWEVTIQLGYIVQLPLSHERDNAATSLSRQTPAQSWYTEAFWLLEDLLGTVCNVVVTIRDQSSNQGGNWMDVAVAWLDKHRAWNNDQSLSATI